MKIRIYLSSFIASPLFYIKDGNTPYLLQNNQKISSLDKNIFTLFDDNQKLTTLIVTKLPKFTNPHGFLSVSQNNENTIAHSPSLSDIKKENDEIENKLTHPSEILSHSPSDIAPNIISFGRPYTTLEAFILSVSSIAQAPLKVCCLQQPTNRPKCL